ncbi:hypothetical protein [Brochothrix campestris]|uniref:DUF4190 domain-containing protein n=1 Tax=Brochothrix campestris FSL F6-1037 TaxID=1265861 RepID=W7CH78_9LIST|nr:hypothetical protein [Brochothrix campestris]EUJ35196.1 hypothetical protein BCAMP_12005 [Brochothrix campestris FSL F6-1037]
MTVKKTSLDFTPEVGTEVDVYPVGDDFVINVKEIVATASTTNSLAGINDKAKQLSQSSNSRYFQMCGWAAAIISIFFLPIVFGVVGAICGFIYSKTNQKQGRLIIIVSAICFVISIVILMFGGNEEMVYYRY